MKVTTNHPKGYVVLRDRVNRGAARASNDAMFARGSIRNITPSDVDRASEALAMAMILRVVHITGPEDAPVETEIEPTQAWFDELDDADWKAIERECLKIRDACRDEAKK